MLYAEGLMTSCGQVVDGILVMCHRRKLRYKLGVEI